MPPTTELLIGPQRWILAGLTDAQRDVLLGAAGLRLGEWLAVGQAEVVKHAPHRTVYRVRLSDLDVHVKHYRGDLREWCRQQLRGSRARREYTITREVERRGVPTLEMLLCGDSIRRHGPSESFVVSRTLPGVVSLLDFLLDTLPSLPSGEQVKVRQSLADALGACLARIHQAGVHHNDLHPGNLLVRTPLTDPTFFLIDLPYASVGRPLAWAQARDNLVMLDRWFALRVSGSDRRRVWRAYCLTRSDLALDEHDHAHDLAQLTESTLRPHIGGIDHRCQGGNRHFRAIHAPGMSGFSVNELEQRTLEPILANCHALFDQPSGRVLKKSRSSAVVVLEMRIGGQVRPVVAKRITRVWSDPAVSLFRTPPALRSYRLGHALRFRGLPTPRPLAVWHGSRLGMLGTGYLLLDMVPDAVPLDKVVNEFADLPAPDRRLRLDPLIAELARLLRNMHRFRFAHRDLKASNLLVSPQGFTLGARELREVPPDPGSSRLHLWLIDLVGLRQCKKLSRQRKMRDLARLHVSFRDHRALTWGDRLRLLKLYLREGLADEASWKVWWREIDRFARDKIARNQRLGRVIG